MKDDKKNKFLSNLFKKKEVDAAEQPAEQAAGQEVEAAAQNPSGPRQIPEEKLYLTPLFELYRLYTQSGVFEEDFSDLLTFEEWLLGPVKDLMEHDSQGEEVLRFEEKLAAVADGLLPHEIEQEEDMEESESDSEAEEEETEPVGDTCYTHISTDQMSAYMLIAPAAPGGEELTMETLLEALASANIRAGLDKDLLEKILEEKAYMQVYKIAEGTPVIDGKDGVCIPKIDLESKMEIKQDEQGVSDYKNLDLIHIVSKGDALCEIVPPTKGVAGEKVTGVKISAINGNAAPDPAGKNTELSEDGHELLASVDGQITYALGRYNVEEVLIVKGDVDYSVGNIDFPGSVIIQGDVYSGFSVKAGKDVTVYGMVESATIVAGGNVTLQKGMNGNYSGSLEVQGDVTTSFLENCTVNVDGCLHSNSIVACQVFCGESVFVQGRQGVVIGGSMEVYKSVEAKVIGSKNHRDTIIKLGKKPHLAEKRTQAEASLEEAQSVLDKLENSLKPLSQRKDSLSPNETPVFAQLTKQQELYQQKKEELTETLSEYKNYEGIAPDCCIKGDLIFPSVQVIIGEERYIFDAETSKCCTRLSNEGIEVGTF